MSNKIVDAVVGLFKRSTQAEQSGSAKPARQTRLPPPSVERHQQAVLDSKLPIDVQVALLKRGHRGQQPDDALAYAGSVRDLCAAGRSPMAAVLVEGNVSLETARNTVLQQRFDADQAVGEIDRSPDRTPAPTRVTDEKAAAVFAARQQHR